MSIDLSLLPWPFCTRGWEARMKADADRLLATLGDAAYGTAADRAWREDMGLLQAPYAGHWSRVTLEIGRRCAAERADADMPPPPPVRGAAPASAFRLAA